MLAGKERAVTHPLSLLCSSPLQAQNRAVKSSSPSVLVSAVSESETVLSIPRTSLPSLCFSTHCISSPEEPAGPLIACTPLFPLPVKCKLSLLYVVAGPLPDGRVALDFRPLGDYYVSRPFGFELGIFWFGWQMRECSRPGGVVVTSTG